MRYYSRDGISKKNIREYMPRTKNIIVLKIYKFEDIDAPAGSGDAGDLKNMRLKV
jgi:hypothetical protein